MPPLMRGGRSALVTAGSRLGEGETEGLLTTEELLPLRGASNGGRRGISGPVWGRCRRLVRPERSGAGVECIAPRGRASGTAIDPVAVVSEPGRRATGRPQR